MVRDKNKFSLERKLEIPKDLVEPINQYMSNYKDLIEYFGKVYTDAKKPGTSFRCTLVEISTFVKDLEHYITTYESLKSSFPPKITPEGQISIIRAAAQIHYQIYSTLEKK